VEKMLYGSILQFSQSSATSLKVKYREKIKIKIKGPEPVLLYERRAHQTKMEELVPNLQINLRTPKNTKTFQVCWKTAFSPASRLGPPTPVQSTDL
jgi:hypothetical protein